MDPLKEIFVNGVNEAEVNSVFTDIIELSVKDGKFRQDNGSRDSVPDSWLKPLSLSCSFCHDATSVLTEGIR